MKRASFIVSTAAVLSGCGAHTSGSGVPPTAASSGGAAASSTARSVASAPADPIPANVLGNPIVGEAWRFDGTTAPIGWILAQGQTLKIADQPALFRVLGRIAGGDGTTTFALPKSSIGYVVAASGTEPKTTADFARLGRHMTYAASLAATGTQTATRAFTPKRAAAAAARTAAIATQQTLLQSAIVPRFVNATVTPAQDARIAAAAGDARTRLLAALSSAVLAAFVGARSSMTSGSATPYEAARRVAATLSTTEATTILAIRDDQQRALGTSGASTHADLASEAARYLVDAGLTDDERTAVATIAATR